MHGGRSHNTVKRVKRDERPGNPRQIKLYRAELRACNLCVV